MTTRLMMMLAAIFALGVGGTSLGQDAPTNPRPPKNDEPTAAKLIRRIPASISESITAATFGADEPTPSCAAMGQSVWFTFTPTADGLIETDTQGSTATNTSLDTVIAIYTFDGTSFTEVGCNNDATGVVDFNDPYASQLFLSASANVTYYFQVGTNGGGYDGANLQFNLNPAPANDEFSSAQNLARVNSTFKENTTGATLELGEPQPSNCPNMSQTVWFTYTATASTSLEADTKGSSLAGQTGNNYDTVISVYTYDGTNFTEVTCSDDSGVDPNNGNASQVFWTADPNVTYYIQVGSYSSNQYGGAQLQFNLNKGP